MWIAEGINKQDRGNHHCIQEAVPCTDGKGHNLAHTGVFTVHGSWESLPGIYRGLNHTRITGILTMCGSLYCTQIVGVITQRVREFLLYTDCRRHYHTWIVGSIHWVCTGGITACRSWEALPGMDGRLYHTQIARIITGHVLVALPRPGGFTLQGSQES